MYAMADGKILTHVHARSACEDRSYGCPIHGPSEDNPLRDAPLVFTDELVAMRQCRHLAWHPDPDDALFRWRVLKKQTPAHGCCPFECCETPEGFESR